ncbi:hypothetical protein FOZ61_010611 [Perkinsus olseni]|uniref:WDHD1/CFT4 second beta-propeller domain-containing protein n=1 Tax=Perkinsus olseni TaxID=32597 RepID=A0A7J6M2F0_PEROL|nr:hypothetical protein FOZ61_010611 [Perkinsus olseni]KAF4672033.1 hypothetical protein FOL46_009580 [Perkinsus olseni]
MVASAATSGLIMWAVADGGDATRIRYCLAHIAGSGSRISTLSEGCLPVSGGHHSPSQAPTLTWIGMTIESLPLSMDSVGMVRALLPTGVSSSSWPSTDLRWTPVYDCVAELQRENEGFWAIGGTGLDLHITRTRYEDAYEPRGLALPIVIPRITWRIRLSATKCSDKTSLGYRPENERAFAERALATWMQFCHDRGVNSEEDAIGIKKTTVALDKKLAKTFSDLVQSKQVEAAYDTSTLALHIPATPGIMAKIASKLGQPLLAARIELDIASATSMPAAMRQAQAATETVVRDEESETQKTAPVRVAGRKRRQIDDMDDSRAAKVLRADGLF